MCGFFLVWVYFFVFKLNCYLSTIRTKEDNFFFDIRFIKTVVIFPVNRKQSICERQHCLKQFKT